MAASSSMGLLGLLLGGKALRAGFLFWSFELLHVQAFPVPVLAFLLLAACAVVLLAVVRPWTGGALRVSPMLLVHGMLLAANALCFHLGLLHYGPLK